MRLTKDQTNFLKGIGIISIMFHNFFHLLPPYIGENEFDWNVVRIYKYGEILVYFPEEFLNISFSYFGHYGVQLFIVLSAYGLAVKYIGRQEKVRLIPFMIDRLKKIYPVYVVAILFLIIALRIVEGRFFNFYEWRDVVLKLLFVNNFLPNKALTLNGPWWFFSLIVQLYVFFPVLFMVFNQQKIKYLYGFLLLLVYYLVFIWVQPLLLVHGINMWHLFIGHLPEYILGFVFVFNPKFLEQKLLFLGIAVVVFVLGNFVEMFFPMTFISVSYLLVHFLIWIEGMCIVKYKRMVIRMGELSMYLFATHGFLREPLITYANEATAVYKIVYSLLFIVLSLLVGILTEKIILYIYRVFRLTTIKSDA